MGAEFVKVSKDILPQNTSILNFLMLFSFLGYLVYLLWELKRAALATVTATTVQMIFSVVYIR